MNVDGVNPCFRKRANLGAAFSSLSCPPRAGLSQSCEIPFGVLLTPLASDQYNDEVEKQSDKVDEEALICINCMAYFNMYATIDIERDLWTCPLCHQQNAAPSFSLQNQAKCLKSPTMEYRRALTQQGRHDAQKGSSLCYVFVVDANIPTNQMQSICDIIVHLLDNSIIESNALIGLIVYSANVSIYQIGFGFTGICSADVYPCQNIMPGPGDDLQMIDSDVTNSRSYLTPVNESEGNRVRSTILQIMKTVAAGASQDPSKISKSDNTTNGSRNAKLSRKEILRLRRENRLKASKVNNISTRPFTSSYLNNSSQRSVPSNHRTKKTSEDYLNKKSTKYQQRCTGTAVRLAVDLALSSLCLTSRILLFTNGCPNMGIGSVVSPYSGGTRKPIDRMPLGVGGTNGSTSKGKMTKLRRDAVDSQMMDAAIEYFKNLGEEAFQEGIGIDIFCAGNTALGVPALQALAVPSSGYTLPHASFTDSQFKKNVVHLLKHTSMSKSVCEVSDINGCILDLRMPSFIIPTQAIGPGEGVSKGKQGFLPCEGRIFSSCAALAVAQDIATHNLPSNEIMQSTLSRLRLGRFDPLSTFSILLQVNEDIYDAGEKQAFFQFIIRYMDSDGITLVTRVYSHRLSVARTVHDFLDGIDEEVVPVLLGREAILRSMFRRDRSERSFSMDKNQEEILAVEAKKDLDATVHRISKAYRMLSVEADIGSIMMNGEPSTKPSLDFAFPPELVDALHMLHHLRRGFLLDPSLHSAEDRAVFRDLFLRLPLEDSLFMMAPSLLSIRVDFVVPTAPGMDAFEPVPPETLVLWDNVIIAGDNFDSLFVWSGRALPESDSRFNPVRNQCKTFLVNRAKHRFPAPSIHILSEHDSMGRRFTSRLVPSHLDPPEQQIAHFPSLASLSQDEINQLRNKFRFFDDAPDASFRRWFWTTASASSKVAEQGYSLCE